MLREDCMEMFKRIPEGMHPQVNLVLRNTFSLAVDTVARFEETYIVFRGREGGTSDDGRAFFVPYDEISYIRVERVVRVGELKQMYGEQGYQDSEDRFAEMERQLLEQAGIPVAPPKPVPTSTPMTPMPTPAPTAAPGPVPVLASDPASIARQNLLDRIRAARANLGGTTGRLDGK
jgi:hypothetical protein